MTIHHSSFWLLLTMIYSAALPTNDGAIAIEYYVRPSSASSATCPDQPCLTFNDYAREKDQYFLDGCSFVFLSGVHQLDLRLQLESISNVYIGALKYNGSAQVLISPMVNISWVDSHNVTITGLDIFLSGLVLSSERSLFSALFFRNITNILFFKLSFFGNNSLQSTAIETHLSVVNFSDVMVWGARSLYGAALIANNSTIKFIGQNFFVSNNAVWGGAMMVIQSALSFHGNISFVNNLAGSSNSFALGGAIFCQRSLLSFSSSALFKRNFAGDFNTVRLGQGGGIFARLNCILIFEESSSTIFTKHISGLGGAISISGTELIMEGKVLLDSNLSLEGGGALNAGENSNILCNSSKEQILFRNNNCSTTGGAIYTHLSIANLKGVLFEQNMARQGGAIFSEDYILHIFMCDFYNNTAQLAGSAVFFNGSYHRGTVIFNGTNSFRWNLGFWNSAVRVSFADMTFSGESKFMYNTATRGGGGSLALLATSSIICGNLTFYRNHARYGGGIYGFMSDVTICGNDLLIENHGNHSGGGMYFSWCNLNITGQATFFQNSASNGGGSGINFRHSNVTISGSMNISGGFGSFPFPSLMDGSLKFLNCTVSLIGMLNFKNNTAKTGGAVHAQDSRVDVLGCIQCINNSVHRSGGALFTKNSTINFRNNVNTDCNIFQNNIAGVKGGAIYAEDSIISLSGSQRFSLNSAIQGGAIAIDSKSKLVLSQPLQANFIENNASVGGAIFYEDSFSTRQCAYSISDISDCFIKLDSTSNVQLSFVNNFAKSAGAVLYGGDLDRCRLYIGGGIINSCGNRVGGNYSIKPYAMINEISTSISVDNITSNISSDPIQVCFCDNDVLNCSDVKMAAVRGKEFTLMVLIVGQNDGIIPSSVRTSLDNDIHISAAQRIQLTAKECKPLKYRLSSVKNTIELVLFPDGPCRDAGRSRRVISISFLPCPDGFTLEGSECVCEERLQRYTNSCNVDDNSIKRDSNTFWMGAIYENGTYEGLILHSECPFDYCVDTPVLIQLNNIDIQCNHNHSGILCGSCTSGYSIVFSTLHCLPCSNAYIGLILPFILAGFVLVALLLLLKISVVNGAINGLIFYANVIQVNRSIFFPPEVTNVLIIFIAWLNLDLGIETCFFDGMNTYIFTWLQFVFPLYVWFLIGLIIVLSRYSIKIARVLGKNPVAALATLFLLSYSKILRTIIVALSFTILEYPGNIHQVVWLYDGNVRYFQSASHIVLGTVAIIVLLFLFLPYTLLLLCGHWLQAYSDRWIFSWLNKIMPLMDAYHAPYKKEGRYWTGLLLLVRCALFLTFAFNSLGNASGNLLAIVSVTAGLLILSWLRVNIYESLFNDFLEAAFLLNLCILAAGTYHVKEIGGNQAALAYTSVGIAFVLFICILLYHMYLRLHTTLLWKKTHSQRHYILNKLRHSKEEDAEANVVNNKKMSDMVQLPTVSIIELDSCEPLLA